MTSYPSYPELPRRIAPELSHPLPIGEDSSGVQLTAELSQGELKAKATRVAIAVSGGSRQGRVWVVLPS